MISFFRERRAAKVLIAFGLVLLSLSVPGRAGVPLAIVLIGDLLAGGTMAIFLMTPVYKGIWDIKNRFQRRDENA
ncbi:MAG: Acriflavin resistance protein [Synergistales bacterium 58_81]|nr:MAG: Acriflavin resistance protein [Synergistales bacterium 57_84]KUK88688.1 MAG: Acriflavin resistance protein [Synergistales bacterium 58_81]